MKKLGVALGLSLLILLVACQSSGGKDGVGEAIAVQNVGSDTIVNLAVRWAERYQEQHPRVRITVSGGGSGTGIAGLINGTVDIANASRRMKPEEIETAQANGIEPIEHVIAGDP